MGQPPPTSQGVALGAEHRPRPVPCWRLARAAAGQGSAVGRAPDRTRERRPTGRGPLPRVTLVWFGDLIGGIPLPIMKPGCNTAGTQYEMRSAGIRTFRIPLRPRSISRVPSPVRARLGPEPVPVCR